MPNYSRFPFFLFFFCLHCYPLPILDLLWISPRCFFSEGSACFFWFCFIYTYIYLKRQNVFEAVLFIWACPFCLSFVSSYYTFAGKQTAWGIRDQWELRLRWETHDGPDCVLHHVASLHIALFFVCGLFLLTWSSPVGASLLPRFVSEAWATFFSIRRKWHVSILFYVLS